MRAEPLLTERIYLKFHVKVRSCRAARVLGVLANCTSIRKSRRPGPMSMGFYMRTLSASAFYDCTRRSVKNGHKSRIFLANWVPVYPDIAYN